MKNKLIVSLILLTLLLNFSVYSFATSIKDLEQQKNDAQNQKNELEKEQEEVKNKKSNAMKKVEELDSQISDSEDKLDALKAKIKELEDSIVIKEKEIKEAEEKQQKQEEILEKRLVAQYKNGKVSYLSILLNPSSFLNFFSNMHNIEKIAKLDSELVENIRIEKANLEKAKEELSVQKNEVKTAKAEAEKENVKLKNAKTVKNAEIAKLTEEEKKLQQQIELCNAEMKKADVEIAKALASKEAQAYNGSFSGTLSWPISSSSYGYNIITSGYGRRDQPTAGASTNHKALDIGVRYQPVYAPADGYIVTAGSVSGYGNFIMIKHTNNLYTCYGHLSSYNVSTGHTVKRGQQIAISGNTGISSGPHLHFEVRTSGSSSSKVNPLMYISDDVYSKLIFR